MVSRLVGTVAAALGLVCGLTFGQVATKPVPGTLPMLMLSDLHFDPFRDPGKVAALAGANVEAWDGILAKPNSESQPASYAALEAACKVRGEDTGIALLNASLMGAQTHAATARFVTVSGDLLVHQFECRYHVLMGRDEAGLNGFAAKTAAYVLRRVGQAFPAAAVYVALGNNDSGCGDYRMDVRDPFLAATGAAVARGWRGASEADASQARETYRKGGYYALALAGVARTRLLVLNDTYLSSKYQSCAGERSGVGATEELAWLAEQMTAAERRGEKVWVLGHIPPGVDVYSTLRHLRTMCSVAPERFLATDALAKTLEEHGDTVRLAIFGHTHTDELRVLGQVPVKLVGSVTPINGNSPSFTIGQVDSVTAKLQDYAVFVGSNATGLATIWTREYSFGEAYAEKEFSAANLRDLIAKFRAEPNGAASTEYQRDFFGREDSPLPLVWRQYVCALDHMGGAAFHDCMCAGQ